MYYAPILRSIRLSRLQILSAIVSMEDLQFPFHYLQTLYNNFPPESDNNGMYNWNHSLLVLYHFHSFSISVSVVNIFLICQDRHHIWIIHSSTKLSWIFYWLLYILHVPKGCNFFFWVMRTFFESDCSFDVELMISNK